MAANFSDLLNSYNQAFNQAKDANNSRYEAILQGYSDRYARGIANLEGLGATESADIARKYSQAGAQQTQSLASRGLGNTTVVNAVAQGNLRNQTREQGALQERVRQQRLNTDAQLSGDKLQFQERRTDAYPDPSMLMQLGLAMGQGRGASGIPLRPGGVTGSMTGGPRLSPGLGGGNNGYQPFGGQSSPMGGTSLAGPGTGPGTTQNVPGAWAGQYGQNFGSWGSDNITPQGVSGVVGMGGAMAGLAGMGGGPLGTAAHAAGMVNSAYGGGTQFNPWAGSPDSQSFGPVQNEGGAAPEQSSAARPGNEAYMNANGFHFNDQTQMWV